MTSFLPRTRSTTELGGQRVRTLPAIFGAVKSGWHFVIDRTKSIENSTSGCHSRRNAVTQITEKSVRGDAAECSCSRDGGDGGLGFRLGTLWPGGSVMRRSGIALGSPSAYSPRRDGLPLAEIGRHRIRTIVPLPWMGFANPPDTPGNHPAGIASRTHHGFCTGAEATDKGMRTRAVVSQAPAGATGFGWSHGVPPRALLRRRWQCSHRESVNCRWPPRGSVPGWPQGPMIPPPRRPWAGNGSQSTVVVRGSRLPVQCTHPHPGGARTSPPRGNRRLLEGTLRFRLAPVAAGDPPRHGRIGFTACRLLAARRGTGQTRIRAGARKSKTPGGSAPPFQEGHPSPGVLVV